MYRLHIDFEDEYLDRIYVGETDIDTGGGKYLTIGLVGRLIRAWVYDFYNEKDMCAEHVYSSDTFKLSDKDFEYLLLDNGHIRLSGKYSQFTFIIELYPIGDS